MKNRFKNIYFWLGLIGVIFSAAGVNIEILTSWPILFDSLIGIISNPFLFMSVIAAITGVFVDTSTPGLYDKEDK